MGGEGAFSCAQIKKKKKIPGERDGGRGVDAEATRPPRAPPAWGPERARPGRLGARAGAGAAQARTGSVGRGLGSRGLRAVGGGWGARDPRSLRSRLSETCESVQTLPLSTLTPTIIWHRP